MLDDVNDFAVISILQGRVFLEMVLEVCMPFWVKKRKTGKMLGEIVFGPLYRLLH
jgi:hypothetical protein